MMTEVYRVAIHDYDVTLIDSGETEKMDELARQLNRRANNRNAYVSVDSKQTAQQIKHWILTGRWQREETNNP